MDHQPKLIHRPGYAEGSIMPLHQARWIHARTIVGICSIDQGGNVARLFASDGSSLDLHCLWGVQLREPDAADRSCVSLIPSVRGSLDVIVAWEKTFPDEPRIGSPRRAA